MQWYSATPIRYVALLFECLWLSDICNGTGDQVLKLCWTGSQSAMLDYAWPQTIKPDAADWWCWQSMLTDLLHLGHQQTLAWHLGAWISTPSNGGWFLSAQPAQSGTRPMKAGCGMAKSQAEPEPCFFINREPWRMVPHIQWRWPLFWWRATNYT